MRALAGLANFEADPTDAASQFGWCDTRAQLAAALSRMLVLLTTRTVAAILSVDLINAVCASPLIWSFTCEAPEYGGEVRLGPEADGQPAERTEHR
ncbi:hypothetical protein [Bradyrhizobium sp. ARR65]|uniref:hypothetical protein n=1 Tax=Bradyrhizobium sp. ARR65 TaxID=1040989 RepID=UPI0018DE816A|nr:hypothetical protein [Bradyrhizobium sp. ARR65]